MAEPPNEVESLSEETAFQGFFRLVVRRFRHRRFDGGWSPVLTRELFERGHAVAVLPYDPVTDRVVMIRQFRAGAYFGGQDGWPLDIIAGIIEADEPPDAVARREAKEEAGVTLVDLIKIAAYLPSPGGGTETITLYCALTDASEVGGLHGLAEEGEDIRVEVMPAETAIAFLDSGAVLPSAAVIALHWLARNRARLRS